METVFISATEASKMLRKELVKTFPGVKFSVRKSTTQTIFVNFEGPREMTSEVQAVGDKYEGASFDGSIDLESYITQIRDGVEVRFGTRYVICQAR